MPQNEKLSPDWRKMLGDKWRDIHKEWLHRLGNLTLTGYNSTYSDKPFAQKKKIKGGFEESSVRLNKFIREQSNWTPVEMRQRGKNLAKQALSIWPQLIVEKSLVDAANAAEMRLLAKQQDVNKVPMSESAKKLFEQLRARIREIDNDIYEIAEQKSVSYHGPDFFLEVLPRKNRITLLLDLDFNEVEDADGVAQDTSVKNFFVNAVHEGGVYISVREYDDVERAMPFVRQARALARA